MLPNFICIGAGKTGTTTLHFFLDRHPEIFLPPQKETHFFDDSIRNGKGAHSVFYEANYFADANHKIVGDFTPSYITQEFAPKRMHDLLGKELKILVCMRNPVDRAFSDYWMFHESFWDPSISFATAIQKELEGSKAPPFKYLNTGLYAHHIKRFLNYFPINNIFIIINELDLHDNMEASFKKLLNFLDVDPEANLRVQNDTKINVNVNSTFQILDADTTVDAATNEPLDGNTRSEPEKNVKVKVIPAGSIRIKIRHQNNRYIINPSDQLLDALARHPVPEKPSEEFKNRIIRDYFYEDIKELESLIGRDLSIWYQGT